MATFRYVTDIPRLTHSIGWLSSVTGCTAAANSAFPSAEWENPPRGLVVGMDAAIAVHDKKRESLGHDVAPGTTGLRDRLVSPTRFVYEGGEGCHAATRTWART
jgi:hypothetical protein